MAAGISARPRQYWDNYASRFKNKSLADAYGLRPPYPEETYDILRDRKLRARHRVPAQRLSSGFADRHSLT